MFITFRPIGRHHDPESHLRRRIAPSHRRASKSVPVVPFTGEVARGDSRQRGCWGDTISDLACGVGDTLQLRAQRLPAPDDGHVFLHGVDAVPDVGVRRWRGGGLWGRNAPDWLVGRPTISPCASDESLCQRDDRTKRGGATRRRSVVGWASWLLTASSTLPTATISTSTPG